MQQFKGQVSQTIISLNFVDIPFIEMDITAGPHMFLWDVQELKLVIVSRDRTQALDKVGYRGPNIVLQSTLKKLFGALNICTFNDDRSNLYM